MKIVRKSEKGYLIGLGIPPSDYITWYKTTFEYLLKYGISPDDLESMLIDADYSVSITVDIDTLWYPRNSTTH